MEHPILFLCLILEKLGVPSGPHYYEHADKYGILAKVFAPHMVYSYFVCIFIIVLALLNPMEVFRVGAISLFDPELTVWDLWLIFCSIVLEEIYFLWHLMHGKKYNYKRQYLIHYKV